LDDQHDIGEVRLGCADLTGKPLQEMELPEGAFIVLIRRDGDVLYPRGHTVLQMGDLLTLMGPQDTVRELSRRCQ
jgi:Trk K+ transport system NAD-binding subunit